MDLGAWLGFGLAWLSLALAWLSLAWLWLDLAWLWLDLAWLGLGLGLAWRVTAGTVGRLQAKRNLASNDSRANQSHTVNGRLSTPDVAPQAPFATSAPPTAVQCVSAAVHSMQSGELTRNASGPDASGTRRGRYAFPIDFPTDLLAPLAGSSSLTAKTCDPFATSQFSSLWLYLRDSTQNTTG
jgi:hypothetical protein